MVEAIKHTYILEEYQGYGGPDQGVLDMKGVKVMLNVIVKIVVVMTFDNSRNVLAPREIKWA